MIGEYADAVTYAKQALAKTGKPAFIKEDPYRAVMLNSLALHLSKNGALQEAKDTLEEALKLCGPDDGKNATTKANLLGNLGQIVYEIGEYYTAKSYFERALKIQQEQFSQFQKSL